MTVLPISNPDQLNLFLKKEIDGAWTVEPWVSRLMDEAGFERELSRLPSRRNRVDRE